MELLLNTYDTIEDVTEKIRKLDPEMSREKAQQWAQRALSLRDGRCETIPDAKPLVTFDPSEDLLDLADRVKAAEPLLSHGEAQVYAQRLKYEYQRGVKSIQLTAEDKEDDDFDAEVTALTARGVEFGAAQIRVQKNRADKTKAVQLTYLRANRRISLDQLCNVLERKFGMHHSKSPARAEWLMNEVQDEPIRLTAEEEAYVRTADKNEKLAAHAMKLLSDR